MPNLIFRLGLTSGEILVYAYLMYCEDRKTFQCYPSYSTIGEAIGVSNNTVKKYVDGLRKKGMITTEYTTVKTKDGRVHNGSLRYTLLPIEPVEEAYFQKMLRMQSAKIEAKKKLEKYEKTRKEQK
ncbi:MAG: helix-turn-helix domain-containing protein [Clostridia bacterium]|nr:helix-turn-helix domain-containing protein [Clostridia bacterium]